MKLVIDIPDEVYEMSEYSNILESSTYHLARCVKNGKPVKEAIIYDDDGIGHKVYEECE